MSPIVTQLYLHVSALCNFFSNKTLHVRLKDAHHCSLPLPIFLTCTPSGNAPSKKVNQRSSVYELRTKLLVWGICHQQIWWSPIGCQGFVCSGHQHVRRIHCRIHCMSIFDVCGCRKRPVHSLEGWPLIKATPRCLQASHSVLEKKQLDSRS